MKKIEHLLIFEPKFTGHSPLYIKLLYNYLLENKPAFKVSFLVNPNITARLAREDGIELQPVGDKISILFISENEIVASQHKKLWIRALKMWNLMKKYLKITGADHGHFLYLDYIQFPLALRLPFLPRKGVSGLLFHPPISPEFYGNENSLKLREVIRAYRKNWFYAQMLNNSALSFVYTLNPYFPSFARKHFVNGNKVYHLPDPSMFPTGDIHLNDEDCALARGVGEGKKVFLLFGALTKRKGIFELMEALKHLEQGYSSQIAVVFAGRLQDEIRSEFFEKVASYKRNNQNAALIHVEDRFLSTNEIICLLQHCDMVLAPYQRTISPSGVVLWAAGAKKPILTQNYALLGYQVRTYELGISVDTTKPKEIADALKHYLNNKSYYKGNTTGMQRLHAESLPENFARTFFAKFMSL